jgi:hypothetical protein
MHPNGSFSADDTATRSAPSSLTSLSSLSTSSSSSSSSSPQSKLPSSLECPFLSSTEIAHNSSLAPANDVSTKGFWRGKLPKRKKHFGTYKKKNKSRVNASLAATINSEMEVDVVMESDNDGIRSDPETLPINDIPQILLQPCEFS